MTKEEIRAPSIVMEETMDDLIKLKEHQLENQKLAIEMSKDERVRRLEKLQTIEEQATTERIENIAHSMRVSDQEKARRIAQHTCHQVKENLIQQHRVKEAISLADEEKARQIAQHTSHQVKEDLVQTHRIKEAIKMADNERNRRQAEDHSKNVKESLLRKQSISKAVIEAENERTRRMLEEQHSFEDTRVEREENQAFAIHAMEGERLRRLSTDEHREKMDSISSPQEVELSSTTAIYMEDFPIETEQMDRDIALVKEMRQRLAERIAAVPQYPEVVGDVKLLRTLRATDNNVDVACKKYLEMLDWRAANDIDRIRDDIVENNLTTVSLPNYEKLVQYIPFVNMYECSDLNGNVICYERTGYADAIGLMKNVSTEEFDEFYRYEMEYRQIQLDQKSREQQKLIRFISIRDLKGFNVSLVPMTAISRTKSLVKLGSSYYPESCAGIYFINTPWVFQTIWKIIRLWFNQDQLKKIRLERDSRILETIIDKSQLPDVFGGTRTDIVVPETGKLAGSAFQQLQQAGATIAEINQGTALQVPYIVREKDTICWEFDIESHDIDFQVKFRTQGEGGAVEEEVVSKERFAAGTAQYGTWVSDNPGTVVLVWSNVFSWRRKKQVAYKASIIQQI